MTYLKLDQKQQNSRQKQADSVAIPSAVFPLETCNFPGKTVDSPLKVQRAGIWGFLLHVEGVLSATDAARSAVGEEEDRKQEPGHYHSHK